MVLLILVTLTCVCRSKLNQKQAYNGHERATDIIFNGIVLKNGLLGNLVGSQIGKTNDYATLPESGLLDNPSESCMVQLAAIFHLW